MHFRFQFANGRLETCPFFCFRKACGGRGALISFIKTTKFPFRYVRGVKFVNNFIMPIKLHARLGSVMIRFSQTLFWFIRFRPSKRNAKCWRDRKTGNFFSSSISLFIIEKLLQLHVAKTHFKTLAKGKTKTFFPRVGMSSSRDCINAANASRTNGDSRKSGFTSIALFTIIHLYIQLIMQLNYNIISSFIALLCLKLFYGCEISFYRKQTLGSRSFYFIHKSCSDSIHFYTQNAAHATAGKKVWLVRSTVGY